MEYDTEDIKATLERLRLLHEVDEELLEAVRARLLEGTPYDTQNK